MPVTRRAAVAAMAGAIALVGAGMRLSFVSAPARALADEDGSPSLVVDDGWMPRLSWSGRPVCSDVTVVDRAGASYLASATVDDGAESWSVALVGDGLPGIYDVGVVEAADGSWSMAGDQWDAALADAMEDRLEESIAFATSSTFDTPHYVTPDYPKPVRQAPSEGSPRASYSGAASDGFATDGSAANGGGYVNDGGGYADDSASYSPGGYDFGYVASTPYATEGDAGGALTAWRWNWFITHWWSYAGQCILSMSPGDVVTTNGITATVAGSFDVDWNTASEDGIRAIVGDAIVYQTCDHYAGPDAIRIVYCY